MKHMPKIRQVGYQTRIERIGFLVTDSAERERQHNKMGQFQMAGEAHLDLLALRETMKREKVSKRLENNIKLLADAVAGDVPGTYDEKALVTHIREDIKELARIDRMEVT